MWRALKLKTRMVKTGVIMTGVIRMVKTGVKKTGEIKMEMEQPLIKMGLIPTLLQLVSESNLPNALGIINHTPF